jgi:cell shape-determining protein MreD
MAQSKGRWVTGIGVFYLTLFVLKHYFEMLSQGPPHWILASIVYWSVVAIVGLALWYAFSLVERFFIKPKPPTSQPL